MKNPQTKKYGTNSDERESYFPNCNIEQDKIVGEPVIKNNLNKK
jgi:hypothetical protein